MKAGVRSSIAGCAPAACASDDLLLIFSVGGGNVEQNISPNLVAALKYAKSVGAKIIGIVGRDGGYTATVADACVLIPTVNPAHTHSAYGSFPGGGLASAGFASGGKDAGDEMGIDGVGAANSAPFSLTATALSTGLLFAKASRFRRPRRKNWKYFPVFRKRCSELKSHGYELLVVTNQPDVGRGKQSRAGA